jgi:hypothetical protein
MFEDSGAGDIEQAFYKTVIRHKGQPVFVDATAVGSLQVSPLMDKGDSYTVKLNDKELDFTPVPLGMADVNNTTCYLFRKPSRQWKQGLFSANIDFYQIDPQPQPGLKTKIITLRFQGLVDCILGHYPTIDDAIKSFESSKANSRALSHDFAITKELELYFRDRLVAVVDDENGKPKFKRSNKFLNMLFEENVHAC